MSEDKILLTKSSSPQPGSNEYVPPATVVPLPSQGKVYPAGTFLAGKELLEVKAMTAKDEDILTSQALIRSGKVLDVLLKSCVDNRVDTEAMLVGDRNAVLTAIRITGYGQDYSVEVNCPCCEERCKYTFDLAQLPVKHIGADIQTIGFNEFYFLLPISKKMVKFKLFTGADEAELSIALERSKKVTGGAESLVTTRLIHQILSIDGESDKGKLANVIRNLPARDSRELRRYIDDISPGVNMMQTFVCSSCGITTEVDVPMGTEFFWP